MKLPSEVSSTLVEASSRVSIRCDSVNVNVIGAHPPPPAYERVIRERRLQQTSNETRGLPTSTEHCPLPPVTTFQFPYATNISYPNSRIPSVPNTPCTTVSSPMSSTSCTSTPATSPVFTFPTAPFPGMRTIPSPINVKQEPLSSFEDDGMSDSGSNMTDEEVIDMVDQMREESSSPDPSSPLGARLSPPLISQNEWTTSTFNDKQFFSNVVTTKGETIIDAATSSFQSSMNYPTPFCDYPSAAPTPVIKEEIKQECMSSCITGGESLSCNGFEVPNVSGFNL
ncbi:uncharacterized protein [Amphiura filiformis]|uniref:uncharacterized protein isoform X2 n=1 Tax=Amphiura filiformis TaxID=82378 RepID=UPI003B210FF2